jgi:hypothetical protein
MDRVRWRTDAAPGVHRPARSWAVTAVPSVSRTDTNDHRGIDSSILHCTRRML